MSNLAVLTTERPLYDIDFYGDEVIADPYPYYRAMRNLGPAVWLPQNEAWAITRFADVRDALRNPSVFLSGRGVMMNEPTNQASTGTSILTTDGPEHLALRQILMKPLMPGTLAAMRDEMQIICRDLVERLVARGRFDGVADFAHILPVMLVSRMVGLPEDGRGQMLDWANGIFNVMGSMNARFHEGLTAHDLALEYLANVRPESMLQGSLGARLFELVEAGTMDDAGARSMLFSYVTPALDTTINATSSALWLFGENPDQWDLVRQDQSLIPAAIEEAMRLESPIRAFSRSLARDHAVEGVMLEAGSRALIVYASANRDERRWESPDRFDVHRKGAREQLAFGTGVHMCAGMHLARLEMLCLFEALAARVVRFEIGDVRRDLHNVLRGIKSMQVTIKEAV